MGSMRMRFVDNRTSDSMIRRWTLANALVEIIIGKPISPAMRQLMAVIRFTYDDDESCSRTREMVSGSSADGIEAHDRVLAAS